MSSQPSSVRPSPARLSLDTWAVIAALFVAALVRAGFLKHIPW
jgi:hypothetical protein